MAYDLQLMRDAAPPIIPPRELAIYRDVRKTTARPRNVADMLERGYRVQPGRGGLLLDVCA